MIDIETTSRRKDRLSLEPDPMAEFYDEGRVASGLTFPRERVWVETIEDASQLERYKTQWHCLAENALSANPSLEPFVVDSVSRHLAQEMDGVKFVLVWQDVAKVSRTELIGFFVFKNQNLRWGWPTGFASSWQHFFSFLGMPLVHKDYPDIAIAGFLDWARTDGKLSNFLFSQLATDSQFYGVLKNCLERQQNPYRRFDQYERAALRVQQGEQNYLQTSLSGKRRKEYRRLRKRLGEIGELESTSTDEARNIDVWIEEFLHLEARGWKGRQGSAYLCDDNQAAALRMLLVSAFEEGRGLFWKTTLDGKPIAMGFALMRPGQHAWFAKITYDEDFAIYSPGVLLVLDITRSIIERGDISFMDSCALPNHPMIDHVWRERLPIADVLVGLSGDKNSWSFKLICSAETVRRRARACLKKMYYRLRKSKLS